MRRSELPSKPAPRSLLHREGRWGYAFIAPSTILLTMFYLYPLAQTVVYSFTDWNPSSFAAVTPVGLENYAEIFKDAGFIQALIATGLLVIGVVPLSLALGVFLAALMRTPLRGRAILRALIFLPFIAPTVGSALIFTYLLTPFGGLFNLPLQAAGLAPIPFLSASPWSLVAVILFSVWGQVGYTMIIYSSAIAVIPETYFEAARLDGAGVIRQFVSLTVPLLTPTTAFLAVTGTLGALQTFTQIHVLTRGGPAGSSTTLLYWIYEQGFVHFNGGTATAGAIVLLVVGMAIALLQLKFFGRREAVEIQ